MKVSSWFGEVLHVARKDARELRWPLLGYAIFVIVATAHAAGKFAPSSGILDAASILIMFFAIIVTISVVQADSPIDGTAFWVTRPLRASAVLWAKLLFITVGIVALPAIGQWIAVRASLPPLDASESTARSVYLTGMILLGAVMVAALTGSMQACVLASIAILIGSSVAAEALSRFVPEGVHDTDAFVAMVVLGLLAALTYLYVRRDSPRRAFFVGIVIVNTLANTLPQELILPGIDLREPAPARRRPRFIFDRIFANADGTSSASLDLGVLVDSTAPQVILVEPRLTFTTARGTTKSVGFDMPYHLFSAGDSLIPVGGGVKYASDARRGPAMRWSMTLNAHATDRLRESGNSHFALEGRVLLRVPEFAGTIPLDGTVVQLGSGERVRVLEKDPLQNTVRLEESLLERETPNAWSSLIAELRPLRFALVDDSTHESIPLRPGSGGSGSHALLLFGPMARKGATGYVEADWGRKRPPLAHPRVVAFRMVSLGSYPIRVEFAASH